MVRTAIEERLARLEGRADGFRHRLGGLDARIDRLDRRIDALCGRIDALDGRAERFHGERGTRLARLEEHPSWQMVSQRTEQGGFTANLRQKIDPDLCWMVSVNFVLWSTIMVVLIFRA